MLWCFMTTLWPTCAYGHMWIYYTIDVVNLLHVSVREAFFESYITVQWCRQAQHHNTTLMAIRCTQHVNSPHSRNSAQTISSVFYILTYILKLILKPWYFIFVNWVIFFEKHLPEDGHNRWSKHVEGLRRLWCNKFTNFHKHLLVLFPQYQLHSCYDAHQLTI